MKYIISSDSCCDLRHSEMLEKQIYNISLKRRIKGEELSNVFDNDQEYVDFYDIIRAGEKPTTSLINQSEFNAFFKDILDKEPKGDIIHLSISSGLSGTYDNACIAAEKLNKASERKIYVIDTKIATIPMKFLIDELLKNRETLSAEQAVAKVSKMVDHLQIWAMIDDLGHLRRGGRISSLKSIIGTVLHAKPIVTVNLKGKIIIDKVLRGKKSATEYLVDKIKDCSETIPEEVFLIHSDNLELVKKLQEQILTKFNKIRTSLHYMGPVLGCHVGPGSVGLAFVGKEKSNN